MKKTLFAIGLLLALNSHAQNFSTYTPGSLNEGVVYYLPKTVIDIEVIATKIIYTPGDLCQYANRYLRLNHVSAVPETHWEIKEVKVKSAGVPDPNNAYQVKLKEKEVASNVQLTKDGLIMAINTTVSTDREKTTPETHPSTEKLNPNKYLTEEILNATSTAKTADLVAKEIYSLRESKNSLVRGQSEYMPKDGAALKLMLEKIEEQEQALTQMFTGITVEEDHTLHFYITPEDKTVDQIAFRFSHRLGILPPGNLAGSPVYLSINSVDPIPVPDPKTAEKKKKVEGIIYNIPGKARVKVNSVEKTYFDGELPVTQFGTTEVLVGDLFKSKVNTQVVFNSQTGAIVKIDKDL